MPRLNLAEQNYYDAFLELSSERNNSAMSAGPIPISKIRWYAEEELDLNERETEAFKYVLRHLDIHYLNLQAKKAEKRMSS